jgi:hypothetical protein
MTQGTERAAPTALSRAFADAEIRAWVDGQPRYKTYSELAAECRRLFGPRAWPAAKICRYWLARHGSQKGRGFKFEHDTEVCDFIKDRLGRLTLTELAAICRERFGPARAPSRSALHRYLKLFVRSASPRSHRGPFKSE